MGNIGSIEEPQNPTASGAMPAPTAQVRNPADERIYNLYKNIENLPLLIKIKKLEERLQILLGISSVELDIEEMEDPQASNKQKPSPEQAKSEHVDVLRELLDDFKELLNTPYGSLGYLVQSDSEAILKMYGVDTDEDYYLKLKQSIILVSNRKLEEMIVAGGGKRWMGEGNLLYDPAEISRNLKVTDHAVNEIISSITAKLAELGA